MTTPQPRLVSLIDARRAELGVDDATWARLLELAPEDVPAFEANLAEDAVYFDHLLVIARALDLPPERLLDAAGDAIRVDDYTFPFAPIFETHAIVRAYGLERTFAFFDRLPALEAAFRAAVDDRRDWVDHEIARYGPPEARVPREGRWLRRLVGLVGYGEALRALRDGGFGSEDEARLAALGDAYEREGTGLLAVPRDVLERYARPGWDARLAPHLEWHSEMVAAGADVVVELPDDAFAADGFEAFTSIFLRKVGESWPAPDDLVLVRHRGVLRFMTYVERDGRAAYEPEDPDDPRAGFAHGPDVEVVAFVLASYARWGAATADAPHRLEDAADRRARATGTP